MGTALPVAVKRTETDFVLPVWQTGEIAMRSLPFCMYKQSRKATTTDAGLRTNLPMKAYGDDFLTGEGGSAILVKELYQTYESVCRTYGRGKKGIMIDGNKVLFSGMQATGNLTLGNYLGALKNWVTLCDEYQCFYSVVDLHSITIRQDPAELRRRARNLLTLYIAAGIDPEKNCLYYQSHVSGHTELSWILNCFTYMGELNRMTQFKDKSAKHADNINAGLFTYPVLMAADILLYQSDVVPVGKDQLQHLEITRDIAQRFNAIYGDVFTIPEPYVGKTGASIKSLQNPEKKMSKSDENPNASIYLMDDPDTVIRKFKRAVTDSEACVRYSEEQLGIRNLIDIYSACTGKTPEETEREFDGKGYGDFKLAVGEAVVGVLKPLQDRYEELGKNKDYIDKVIKDNAEKANYYATKTLRKVQKKVGFPERIR